jgi:signal transduction histidine kinase
MSGEFWLDWAIMAASLFNTILLVWLGLTVLLNANRRDWGVWLMGGGLLAGALFFISHSAILGQEWVMNLEGLNFWWRAGWFPITVSPFAWYVAVLWYSGFWAVPQSNLRGNLRGSLKRRHRLWLWLMALWLLALIVLMLAANPIPAYEQLVQFDLGGTLSLRNIPLSLLLFPLWMVACILLSLDVLPKPAEVADANTKIARQRSRPWLLGTAGALLAVSLVVAYFTGSAVATIAEGGLSAIRIHTVALYDLALSLLIALSSLLLGQAIVSYEIFTGRVLPRRSFVRHWRNAIILASGYAVTAGWSITAHLRPIYSLLLATLLLTLFYALYSWRSFREREQFMARLRPFVQSQEITPNPLRDTSSASTLLAALCRDVLGTAHAQIIPLGSVAPLVTASLRYPPNAHMPSLRPPRDLNAGMTPLKGADFAPYGWAVSLWDERGRIGALLIGEKLDGGLYSQEEMETAQAAGERIVHLLAGEQMVRRLMEMQRKRTSEQRVMDLRTRRALHDEILPALHLAVLQLSGADRQQPAVQETLHTLAEAHQQIADLLTDAQPAPARAPDPCELVGALRGLVALEFAHSFEQIVWRGALRGECTAPEYTGQGIEVETVYVDPTVGEVVLGAARETIRNAASHGRGGKTERPLCLQIGLCVMGNGPENNRLEDNGLEGSMCEIILTIQDNGIGIEASQRTAASQGSGNGLALHSTLLAMVGGYLTVESPPEGGTLVRVMVAIKG